MAGQWAGAFIRHHHGDSVTFAALLAPETYAAADRVQESYPQLKRAAGMVLLGLGVLLMPVGVLLAGL